MGQLGMHWGSWTCTEGGLGMQRVGREHSTARAGGDRLGRDRAGLGDPFAGGSCPPAPAAGSAALPRPAAVPGCCCWVCSSRDAHRFDRQTDTKKHPRTGHERDKLLVGDASSVPLSWPCRSLLISHLAMKCWTALKFYIPISCENLTSQRCRGGGTVPSSPSSLLGFSPLSPDFVKGPGGFTPTSL